MERQPQYTLNDPIGAKLLTACLVAAVGRKLASGNVLLEGQRAMRRGVLPIDGSSIRGSPSWTNGHWLQQVLRLQLRVVAS